MPEPRIIRRYRNRRLYDTATQEQITLAQVRDLVTAGVEFRVLENDTGRDLTLLVLTQVFGEVVRHGSGSSDAPEVLKALIRKGGDSSMAILSKTVMAAIGALAITRENAEKLIDELIKRGELDKSKRAEAIREAAAKAEERARETIEKVKKSPTTAKAREAAEKVRQSVESGIEEVRRQAEKYRPARAEDLEGLKKTIRNLEAKIEELSARLNKQ